MIVYLIRNYCVLPCIIQAIKSLGEVTPMKHTYSTRRPSITSDTSGTFSRTTSLSEDPSGPLSRSTSRVDSSVPPTPTTPDMDMNAEVQNFAARLQRSLDVRIVSPSILYSVQNNIFIEVQNFSIQWLVQFL